MARYVVHSYAVPPHAAAPFVHRRLSHGYDLRLGSGISQQHPTISVGPPRHHQACCPCLPCLTLMPFVRPRMLPHLMQASQSVSTICASAAAAANSSLQPLRDHHAITPNVLAALHTRERQLLTVMTLRQDLEDKRAKLSAAQLMPASQAKRVSADGSGGGGGQKGGVAGGGGGGGRRSRRCSVCLRHKLSGWVARAGECSRVRWGQGLGQGLGTGAGAGDRGHEALLGVVGG
jgi:hypothetical protein